MQLKLITAAIASLAVGSAIAGPIPQPLDVDDAIALYARAEQAEQAQQAQQAVQAPQAQQANQAQQGEQAKQGEQGKQGDQWLPFNAGVSYNGLGYGSAYFNGLGINAYARGYGYGNPDLYRGGYRGYGRRGWNRNWYGW
ncbi:hypothetical protein PRZ48_008813 [Zasmidium cellare]|uniref:Uncharacterized protein n=1 Tax=Zasmidium cellare TaxID=395010 RepID=A0ABR0EGX4_ZASCE|nr:hypothetical protein PRZ48_008813 [Zasmidium cellare]